MIYLLILIKNGESVLNNHNPRKKYYSTIMVWRRIKSKIKGQLHSEHIFGFCRTFKKITKNLGFHKKFNMNDLQDIIFTTVLKDINVTINRLYLYVPILIPNSQTQLMFNEPIMNNYTITFDSRYTERKIPNDGRELQVDIASAKKIIAQKIRYKLFKQVQEQLLTKLVTQRYLIMITSQNILLKSTHFDIQKMGY